MFESAYQRRSPGFEINDLGFLRRADQQSWNTWAGFFDRKQRTFYNRFQLNNNWWQYWTTDGLPLEAAYNTNMHITFKNNWGWHMGGTLGQLGTTYDDRAARGGPAVRQDPLHRAVAVHQRRRSPGRSCRTSNVNYFRGDGGRNSSCEREPRDRLQGAGPIQLGALVQLVAQRRRQPVVRQLHRRAAATHYTFAHLDQTTTSVTARLNYTFTPNVSLQTYLQPFVSKGTYSNVRQLSATPRADSYDDRYAPFNDPAVTNDPGGFNFKQLQSNVVFRWEYKPGSTLFVVWNEGRQGYLAQEGTDNFRGDVRDLFRLHPANTFLVKVSYWLNR